ncbi:MAG: glycosyltransferase family 2 protein [Gemmiger sp.]|nr:glycosyltransferase family 2 protein [Gemmiger sp.]
MDEPIVSFVVPVYNVKPYLQPCIESILQQTESNWELVLIDDGSTDGSAALCDHYAEVDARITVTHKKNERQAAARNDGMALAKGKWLCFIDADDWVSPALIATATKAAQNAQMVLFGFCESKGDALTSHPVTDKMEAADAQATGYMARKAMDRFCKTPLPNNDYLYASPCCRLYDRAWLQAAGVRFTHGYFEDILFEAKLFDLCSRAVLIPECLYFYRIHAGSTSRGYQPDLPLLEEQLWETQKFVEQHHAQDTPFSQAMDARAVHVLSYMVAIHFCHPDNTAPYQARKADFQQKCAEPFYSQALARVQLNGWPMQRRLLAELIRDRQFFCLNFLNRARIRVQRVVK